MPLLRSPAGSIVNIPDEEAGSAQAAGYAPVSLSEAAQVTTAPASEDRGVLGGINAAATGLLAGATLGGSDYALKALLDKGQFERLAQEREGHPIAAGIGQVAGAVLPAIAAPESLLGRAPSGLISHATGEAVAAGRALGGAEGLATQLAAGGVEGAVQNAGMYLSDTALGDRELSAEGLAASLGPGFAFGVAGGVAALGIEQGTIAARRLFSRVAGTDKAAEAAQSAWSAQYQATVEANNAAADIARARLAEARGAREQAALAKQQAVAQQAEVKARTMPDVVRGPGAPRPVAEPPTPRPVEIAGLLRDKAMAAGDPARLAAWNAENGPRLAELMKSTALSPITLEDAGLSAGAVARPAAPAGDLDAILAMTPEQQALNQRAILSKAAEEEMAAALAEHDASLADLEDILKRLEVPEIEPGEFQGLAVPLEDWGAPNRARGTPGPHEPMRVPITDELSPLPVTSHDLTRQLKPDEMGLTFDPETRNYFTKEAPPGAEAAPATSAKATPLSEEDFQSMASSFHAAIPGEVSDALKGYSNNGLYAQINAPMREGFGKPGMGGRGAVAKHLREALDKIDSGIEMSPAPRSIMVYRGVNGPRSTAQLDALKLGESFVDPAPVSTSYLQQIGEDYAKGYGVRKGVEMHISVPEGYGAAPIPSEFPKEREVLLASGGKFTVTKIEQAADGHKILHLDLVKSEAAAQHEVPAGFSLTAHDANGQPLFDEAPDIIAGIPKYDDIPNGAVARRIAYVVRPSELAGADAGLFGKLRAAEKWAGTEAPAIEINIVANDPVKDAAGNWSKPTGGYVVKDGGKRLMAAAADGDRPVLVRFWPSAQKAKHVTAELDNIGGAVKAAGSSPAATGTLTGRLRDMQSKLGAGASLNELGAPARAEYAATKAVKTKEAAEHFRSEAVAKRESAAPQTFPERFDEAFHRLDKASGGHDYVTLHDLRRELSDVSREEFDAELYKLRKSKHFSLDSADGRQVRLDKAVHAAGIKEAGSNLVYAQRGAKYEPIYKPREAVAKVVASKAQVASGGTSSISRLGAPAAETGAQDAFFANLTRPKTRDAYVAQNIGRAMREEGSHAAALAKVEREWAAMGGHPVSTKAVPDAVEDVAAIAEAATKYEKSSARLTEALGPDAPPAAQEAAKAFREAEGHAERKTMERTTRAIDDHAESAARRTDTAVTRRGGKPAVAADDAAPDWLEEARRLGGQVRQSPAEQRAMFDMRKNVGLGMAREDIQKADAALAKTKVSESEARIGARTADDFAAKSRAAAEAARPVAAAPGPTSTLGAIATTIGVAGELGVPGIPHPHDIPIIGPLLGTYLKYRAIKAAAGRFVGRIPATGDARAAALVAKTKDKIATAVDRTLGLAAEMAPKARGALVATSAALGHRLIDDGEPDAPKGANAQQQAAVRIREIANAATQPELVTRMVRKEMRGVADPDLIAAAEQHLIASFEALNRVMPKAPPPNPYSKREWVPSPAAAHDVAQRLSVFHDPETAFVDTTPAKAETLRDRWPRLLEFAQQRLIERVGDIKHPVPYNDRLRNSLLFSVPLDDSMQPDHAAVLQSAHAPSPAAQPPQAPGGAMPSIAGDSNLTALYQTGSDRRAMR